MAQAIESESQAGADSASTSAGRYSVVSVVFDAEFPLLELQARSLARFLDPSLVDEIVVIDNSARGMPDALRRDLPRRYGPLAEKLSILRPADICRLPASSGWRGQQILKLAVASQLRSPHYLVLDAKNHLIGELHRAELESSDGRPFLNTNGYSTHPLRVSLERVLTYLGLQPSDHVDSFASTVTPFVLNTALVIEMIADVEKTSGQEFAVEFLANDLTEFFLYAGWLLKSGRRLDEVHDVRVASAATVWPKATDRAGVEKAIAKAGEQRTSVFAVHRRALGRMDPAGREALAGFWSKAGLFDSAEDATAFIDDFRRGFVRHERMNKLRDLPHLVRTRARRVLKKLVKLLKRR